MASTIDLPEYLRDEYTEECKDMIASLPSHRGWLHRELHLFQGFWYQTLIIAGVAAFQKYFQAQDSDVLLASSMKTGTTWMKALIFAVMNRQRFLNMRDHPLMHKNPHSLVLTVEFHVYGKKEDVDLSHLPSPRIFATHTAFVSLPVSIKDSKSKIVYIGRNPKDTFISLWHFMNELKHENTEKISLEAAFDMFCKGLSPCGPVWEHAMSYWTESLNKLHKILFLKFEEMKANPVIHTRRLAEFLGISFSPEEDRQGKVDDILRLCSFESLSQLEVNKSGKLERGVENNAFFRLGHVGDWKNYLTPEMADRIDNITEEKFKGSGFKL